MSGRKLAFSSCGAASACGLQCVGEFEFEDDVPRWRSDDLTFLKEDEVHDPYDRGTGFAMSAFVDTEECKEAYRIITKKYKLVYQSPVRLNDNSGNMFFFIIYDTRSDE